MHYYNIKVKSLRLVYLFQVTDKCILQEISFLRFFGTYFNDVISYLKATTSYEYEVTINFENIFSYD